MAAPSRVGNSSRTPPFVLVGLLIVLFFVAYKYWSLSSQRSELESELDIVMLKSRDLASQKEELTLALENIRKELSSAKKELDGLSEQGKANKAELENIMSESKRKEENIGDCQKSLADCEGSLKIKDEDIERLRGEKESAQKLLETEKVECADRLKTSENAACTVLQCEAYLKEMLKLISAKVRTSVLKEALSVGAKDYHKLLEGIPVNEELLVIPEVNQNNNLPGQVSPINMAGQGQIQGPVQGQIQGNSPGAGLPQGANLVSQLGPVGSPGVEGNQQGANSSSKVSNLKQSANQMGMKDMKQGMAR